MTLPAVADRLFSNTTTRLASRGRAPDPNRPSSAGFRAVSANYFSALRIPIVSGRVLREVDRETSPFVLVINQAMARRYWLNQDPVGQRIRWASEDRDHRWLTIVGVAGDVKSNGLDKQEAPAVYAPYTQRVFPWIRWSTFVVRTHGTPAGMPPRSAAPS